jgi:hypothetical protein
LGIPLSTNWPTPRQWYSTNNVVSYQDTYYFYSGSAADGLNGCNDVWTLTLSGGTVDIPTSIQWIWVHGNTTSSVPIEPVHATAAFIESPDNIVGSRIGSIIALLNDHNGQQQYIVSWGGILPATAQDTNDIWLINIATWNAAWIRSVWVANDDSTIISIQTDTADIGKPSQVNRPVATWQGGLVIDSRAHNLIIWGGQASILASSGTHITGARRLVQ